MLLFDVNIYVHLHREDAPKHEDIRSFFDDSLASERLLGYAPLALSGFIRIVTHTKIFKQPTDVRTAAAFCASVREISGSVPIVPGDGHWPIFNHLLLATGAKGNIVPDAWFAALAIEHDCTWVTFDRDYSRFPGLKVHYPDNDQATA